MKLIKNLVYITVPSLIFVILFFEVIVFRYIIPASSLPYVCYDFQNQILIFDKNINNRGLYTMGNWARQSAHWYINNFGWNSDIDYSINHNNKPLIAIIGDSYIEAFAVGPHNSITGKLREKAKMKYEVYGFGMSGAALSDYMQLSRYVNKYFKPDILVINVVHNDFDESLCTVKHGEGMLCLECNGTDVKEAPVLPYYPSKIKRILRKSSIVRYLMINLGILGRIERLQSQYTHNHHYNANVDIEAVKMQRKDIVIALDYILNKIKQECSGKKILFMIDAPRQDIYAGKLRESSVLWMNKLLETKCNENDLAFLDLTADFYNDYESNHRKFDVQDGHWNEYGHKIACDALFKKLKEIGM